MNKVDEEGPGKEGEKKEDGKEEEKKEDEEKFLIINRIVIHTRSSSHDVVVTRLLFRISFSLIPSVSIVVSRLASFHPSKKRGRMTPAVARPVNCERV